eukprot:3790904-Prymnesium_polylepis.1
MSQLFDAHFQVLPITYVHLVACMVYGYLALAAATKGAVFTPEADYIFGLMVPGVTILLLNVTTIGLLHLGTSFANPVGGEDYDLAAYSFMADAARASRRI